MGTSDGTVLGTTKILNNGPDDSRFNLVIVAEGFQNSEQSDFNDLCDELVTALQAEPWYPVLGGAINIHRLNVASTDSGTDDPLTCDDGSSGPGTTAATYFDSTFCGGAGVRRCLSGDESIVRDTLDAQLPAWHVAGALVNTTDRGGCRSGNVFWAALSSDWKAVTIHELGHAAFNLGDEYQTLRGCDSGETDRDNWSDGEPMRRNLTTVTDRSTLKWRNLVAPEVPIPTMVNPDCTECDERPNVLVDDLQVGLFEGASTYHCGIYRPAYKCKMRDSSQPFCPVCVQAMAEDLSEFITPAPTLEVVPTFLDFGNVAHDLTLYLSFEVRNRRVGFPGTLQVDLTVPSGEFSYAPGVETSFLLPAPVLESYTSRMIFVAFTASSTGGTDFLGSLQVTSAEDPANSPITVDLQARAVPPPPVDSVLVIDRSGSMNGATGVPGQTKIDHAIEAANLYLSLLKDNDRVGLVRYNHVANRPGDVLLDLEVAGNGSAATGRANVRAQLTLANLNPSGLTTIGGGILLGSDVLDAAVADSRAIVVLTDGIQNTAPDIPGATSTVSAKTPRQRVFAVGLGLNQLEDKLHQIASATNGVAQITGDLVGHREFLLQKLYVQILSDVSDEALVTDPRSVVPPAQSRSTTVYLGEVDVSADFIVLFRQLEPFPPCLRVWLEAPDGTIITPSDTTTLPNVQFSQRNGHMLFRWQFPAFPDRPLAHVGPWRVWVENFTREPILRMTRCTENGGLPLYYSVMCKARSDFRLGGQIIQSSYTPGSPMTIILEPTLYGQPIELESPVEVQMIRPDDTVRKIVLERDEYGLYRGSFTDTALVGPYHAIAEVSAVSPAGNRITRYRQMTGIIFVPGSPDGGGPGGGDNANECEEARELIRRLAEIIEVCCADEGQKDQIRHVSTEFLVDELSRRLLVLQRGSSSPAE